MFPISCNWTLLICASFGDDKVTIFCDILSPGNVTITQDKVQLHEGRVCTFIRRQICCTRIALLLRNQILRRRLKLKGTCWCPPCFQSCKEQRSLVMSMLHLVNVRKYQELCWFCSRIPNIIITLRWHNWVTNEWVNLQNPNTHYIHNRSPKLGDICNTTETRRGDKHT